MAVWSILICCWFIGSVPLALLLGKVMAATPVTVEDPVADVDVFLERLFAA